LAAVVRVDLGGALFFSIALGVVFFDALVAGFLDTLPEEAGEALCSDTVPKEAGEALCSDTLHEEAGEALSSDPLLKRARSSPAYFAR